MSNVYGDYLEACLESQPRHPIAESTLTLNEALNNMSVVDKAKTILWIINETCEEGLATEEELIELLKSHVINGRAIEDGGSC